MASPALVSTKILCPREASSRTAAGIMPTRYSLFLISLGTPIFMAALIQSAQDRTNAIDHTADLAFAGDQRGDQHDGVAADAHDQTLVEKRTLQRLIAALSGRIGDALHLDGGTTADAPEAHTT